MIIYVLGHKVFLVMSNIFAGVRFPNIPFLESGSERPDSDEIKNLAACYRRQWMVLEQLEETDPRKIMR